MQLVDIIKYASENSAFALLLGVVVAIGLYYFVKLFKLIIAKVESSSEVILTVGKSLTNEKGEPVRHSDNFDMISKKLDNLKEITEERLGKADRCFENIESQIKSTKICDIDKCPHLLNIISDMKDLADKFDQFERRASESRITTGTSLDEVRSQMQILASEISQQSKQMVNVLTGILVDKKSK